MVDLGSAGDGNGWVRCSLGHRHWGRFGACGLLLTDASTSQVVLQHRAPGTHEGGTWAVPGGARDSGEDYVTAALRETAEEAGIAPSLVAPIGWRSIDHGGWSYTTVIARAVGPVHPRALNWESTSVRWWPVDQVAGLALHPGFAQAWPKLDVGAAPVTLVVDAANVVGSRPDGWWRDRLGAAHKLIGQCADLARAGIAPSDLPTRPNPTTLDRLLPRIVVVLEGAASAAAELASPSITDQGNPSSWPWRQLEVVAAAGVGDDEVVARSRQADGEVVVVTADVQLRQRLRGSVSARGPRWLAALLER